MELKQSTVTVVKIGPFVGTTGTVITDLTIGQAAVRLSKAGGNMAQKSTATACVHDELGVYFCDFSAADTDTLGRLRLDVDESGSAALAVWHFYDIVSAQYYDAKYGTGRFEADVQELDGASVAAAEFLNMYDGTGYAGGTIKFITTGGTVNTIATGGILAASFAADAIDAAAIAGSAIVAATFATGALAAGAASATTIAANALGASAATIAANALGASAATIAANALGASAATIAASARGASAATIAGAVWGNAAGTAMTFDTADTFGNMLNDLTEVASGDYRFTASALTNAGSGSGASTATIAAAVWNATAASYDTNDAFGNIINDLTEDSGGVYRFTAAAAVQGAASAATIAANALGASATTIAAAVWNAVAASYDINNAFGNIINDLTEDNGGTYRFTYAAVNQGTTTAATINAQVLDVLNVDTFAEPAAGTPAATTTIVTKLGLLYKLGRNKITATSALIAVYNDDGTTTAQTSVISDNGTIYTRGEFV